jgi:hypothetical protein
MLRFLARRSLCLTAALALVLSASAAFADRDAGSKIRGEFGTGFSGRTRSYYSPSYRTYAAPAPTVVRAAPAEPAPAAVAQSPTARRAFSYAPDAQATAPQASAAPAATYYYAPRVERRSVRRSNGHVRSYERADAKFLGHVGY